MQTNNCVIIRSYDDHLLDADHLALLLGPGTLIWDGKNENDFDLTGVFSQKGIRTLLVMFFNLISHLMRLTK